MKLAGLLFVATMTASPFATTAAAQPAGFATEAATLVAHAYPADAPGAAVIVMRGDRLLYAGARGRADLAAHRAITPDTVFRLGSITKQLTAAVVLQLVAERRLSLDDPLSRFFPDWPPPAAQATVRQLLNHTSGLQDFTKIPGFMMSAPTLRPNSTADLVAITRARPAVSAPGHALGV